MLCFANADCVTCFSLISLDVPSCDYSLHVDYSSGFINVLFPARTRYFVYFCGIKWGSLVSRIFQDLLDVSWRFENDSDVVFV